MSAYRCLTLATAFSFSLMVSACQGDTASDKNSSVVIKERGPVPKQNTTVQKQGNLPVYDGVTELEASASGRLSIVDGCVYLVDTNGAKTIIIFPKGSSLSADGGSVRSLNKTATDGDQVFFSGASTTRTFWKSLAPGIAFQPITENCKGDSVWLAGQMTKQ